MSYNIIYTPSGRAREYAPLACNIYRGCGHGCLYCYAPSVTVRESHEVFRDAGCRSDFLSKLQREAVRRQSRRCGGRVLLCFTCDPYQPLDAELGVTRKAIEILHATGHHVTILTKGGSRALRDLDLMGPSDAFATTLTFPATPNGTRYSKHWEPQAADPVDRIRTIEQFHAAGIPTWVSLEPVLDPEATLECIRQTHTDVDLYKVGKLNADHRLAPREAKALAASIDWRAFAAKAVTLLEDLGKPYYIKSKLAVYLPEIAQSRAHRLTLQQVEDRYQPQALQPSLF